MNKYLRGCILIGLLFASGCSLLLGNAYQRQRNIPPGMAVIYLYADGVESLQNALVDRDPESPAIDDSIGMVKGGYFTYLATAGTMRVLTGSAKAMHCIEFETVEGRHYWVKVSSPSSKAPLALVPGPQAEEEIASHRSISTESRAKRDDVYEVDCVRTDQVLR